MVNKGLESNRKQKNIINRSIFYLVGICFFILIWHISAVILNEHNIFPTPLETLTNLFTLLGEKSTYLAIIYSLGFAIISIISSLILGLIFGIISAYSTSFRSFFQPFVAFFKILPTICVTLLIIIFSNNMFSYFIIVFLVVFPLIYETILKGFDSIDDNIYMSLQLEGFYKPNTLFKVLIPEIQDYVILASINALGIGLKVEIMAEILSFSNKSLKGIGYYIQYAYSITFNYIDIYSYIILILFLFIILNLILYCIKKTLKF